MGSCSSKDVYVPTTNAPFEEVRFLRSAKTRIDRYFHHLYLNTKVSQTAEEVVHVRDGVEKFVWSILKIVGNMDSRFAVEDKNLLKVGSFYEGTKLGRIDQFDYIVTLSDIATGMFEIIELNRPVKGIDTAVVIDKVEHVELAQSWKNMMKQSCLVGKKTRENNVTGILDIFLKHIQKACRTSLVKVNDIKYGRIALDTTARPCIDGPSVKLSFTYTRDWHEIVNMVRVERTSSETLTVNITPAIEVVNLSDYIEPQDCLNEFVYHELIKTGSFLLVASENGHFKKTFTETETRIMKNLHQRHSKAFCVVKYLFNGIDKHAYPDSIHGFNCTLFDSYALKTIMLSCSEICPCKEFTEFELFDCVLFLLTKILKLLYGYRDPVCKFYTSLFLGDVTDWLSSDSKIIQIHRLVLNETIKHDLKYWIGEREKYDFSKKPKQYGVTPIRVKILNMLKALNPKKM